MKRLVSCYYRGGYPFESLAEQVTDTEECGELTPDDILVVWGGGDIHPSLYGRANVHTWADDHPSARDKYEWAWMKRAQRAGSIIVGVCRGAQMLCALAGGRLIQHVENHGGSHIVHVKDGEDVVANSLHHQMMYPFDVDHELVAWTDVRSPVHWDVTPEGEQIQTEMTVEPELVLFPKLRGVGVQWHPEMMRQNAPATELVFNCIKRM